MTETLTSQVQVNLTGTLTQTLDLVTGRAPLAKTFQMALTNGTGSGKADLIWQDTRTLATGATEDIDIVGALVDAFGIAITPVKLKALFIYSRTTNTTTLTIGGDAASVAFLQTAATLVAPLNAGGMFLIADPVGITVGAGASDVIQVANSAGATATYDIVFIAASA